MNHPFRLLQVHRCVSAALAGVALTIASGACVFAQDAPENDTSAQSTAGTAAADGGASNAAAPQTAPGPASVFNWHDIPVNENIPIQRASFDAGGYQLIDSQGQTIVVPFLNNSLYVMKFSRSADGTMYFVNGNGMAPILYVPNGGYLANLTVAGAFWYPPMPVVPVYYGIAPRWDAYVAMGWYPGMHYWGGYWYSGGVYVATPGLYIEIGGTRYVGWARYEHYYHMHTGWHHIRYRDREFYHREVGRHKIYHTGRGGRYGQSQKIASTRTGAKWGTRPQVTAGPRTRIGGEIQKQRSTTDIASNPAPRNPIGRTTGTGPHTGTGTQHVFQVPGRTTGTGPYNSAGNGGTGQRPTLKPGGTPGGPRIGPFGGGSPSHPSAPVRSSGGSGGTKKH